MREPRELSDLPAAAGAGEFHWPSPPYHELVLDQAGSDVDYLLVFLRDGTQASGRLRSFLPDEGVLSYQPAAPREADEAPVQFSELLRLQFVDPVGLRRDGPTPEGENAPSELLEAQPFRLELVNGETLEGMTVGYVSALCGLFLYSPTGKGGILRSFVPAGAAKARSIGAPLGQILIKQNLVSSEAVTAALSMQAQMRTQRLGEFLTANKFISTTQLNAALQYKRDHPEQKLGEALKELGFLGRSELETALGNNARERAMPIGEILLKKMGIVDEGAIGAAMADKLAIPRVDLHKLSVSPETIGKVPADIALSLRVVPVRQAEGGLVVAMENPADGAALEQLRSSTRAKIFPVAASKTELAVALKKYYGHTALAGMIASDAGRNAVRETGQPAWEPAAANAAGVHELISALSAESGSLDIAEQQAARSDSALVKLVNRIILDAVQQKASDIHIEANQSPKPTRVRFRRDGVLVNFVDLPAPFRNALVSRIKIMSQLDITERRKPQDGKIDFRRFGPLAVELRVATVPTTGGLEDVVMRVLAAAKPVPLDELGLDREALDTIRRLIAKPHGLFLVCGPTGSGKTTTLHSLLAHLNISERKIWTAEDPIEITQPGLRQVQVNAKIGWTFAAAMRSFMRADPDVIMVGEMRDTETAKIGIEASLTGHLVLSTLHTNSAPESIVRLLDLGMDPFNFADALVGVLAQRLAKRLCPDCKQAYTPARPELEELSLLYCDGTSLKTGATIDAWRARHGRAGGALSLFRATGCPRCEGTGYQGRIPLYELLAADSAIKALVQSRAQTKDVRSAGIAAGMRTLRQHGVERILEGLTDLHQVSAVTA